MYKLIFIISLIFSLKLFSQKVEISVKPNNYKAERTISVYVDSTFYFSKKILPYQSIPQIERVKDNIVLIHSLEGLVEFYSPSGELLVKDSFYSNPPHNEQKLLFCKSENKIAFLISENRKNKIIIYSQLGLRVDSVKVDNGIVSGLVCGNSDTLIAFSIYNWQNKFVSSYTYLVNLTSKLYNKTEQLFEKGKFSNNEKYFLGYTNKSIFLVDINNYETLWNYKPLPGRIILEGKIIGDASFLIEASSPYLSNGGWTYQDIKIYQTTLDGKSKLIYKSTLPVTKIFLEENNGKLFLNIDGKVEQIKVAE